MGRPFLVIRSAEYSLFVESHNGPSAARHISGVKRFSEGVERRSRRRKTASAGGRILFLKLGEIDWIGAADNYTELHAGRSLHLRRSTLTALEARLPPAQFVRISRSTLINISRVREILLHRNGDGTVVLLDGTRLALSRTHRARLVNFLGHK